MLVSCGVRPETGLAADAGLPTGRGVTVGADLASPEDRVGPRDRRLRRAARRSHRAGRPGLGAGGPAGAAVDRAGSTRALADSARRAPARGAFGSRPPGSTWSPVGCEGAVPRPTTGWSPSRTRRPAGTSRSSYDGTGWSGSPRSGHRRSRRRCRWPSSVVRRCRWIRPPCCVPQTGAPDQRSTAEASPTLIPADATICRCNGVTKSDLMGAWDDGCHTVDEMAAADPGHHRVRRLPRDGVRSRRLAHEQSTVAMRTAVNLFVTRPRRVLPRRNIRPDPTKCCARRFPVMDEQRTGRRRLVVVGGGMVAHRLVEALTDRDTRGRLAGRRLRRGVAPAVRPGRADLLLLRPRPRRPAARRARACGAARACGCTPTPPSSASTPSSARCTPAAASSRTTPS